MPYDTTDFVLPVFDPTTITDPRERLAFLRDFIRELPPEKFSMERWHCGTAACIGGWIENLWFDAKSTCDDDVSAAMGLNRDKGRALFYPLLHSFKLLTGMEDYESITTAQAVEVLDHLYKTGEVDWLSVLTTPVTS